MMIKGAKKKLREKKHMEDYLAGPFSILIICEQGFIFYFFLEVEQLLLIFYFKPKLSRHFKLFISILACPGN